MKLTAILGTLAPAAAVIKAASTTAVVAGALYLVDCRLSDRRPEAVDRCWMTALPIMGLGATARGSFAVGYETYNPALRPPTAGSRRRTPED
jgi:hypothetical protein